MSDDPEIRDQLNRIERCLIGDESMGQEGLVARVHSHSRRISALERVGVYLAGASGVVVLLWTVWTQWPRK